MIDSQKKGSVHGQTDCSGVARATSDSLDDLGCPTSVYICPTISMPIDPRPFSLNTQPEGQAGPAMPPARQDHVLPCC